jgi:hypothetical protein
MSERTERLARNEVAFRALNERAREVTQELAFEDVVEVPDIVECLCECANADCDARLRVRVADYELARADPARFVVVPGHEVRDIERPVFEREGVLIVEKHPGERAIAAAADPRG